MNHMHEIFKRLCMIACCLLLSSCGTKLSYNYADWIISWYVDDYVDWNNAQQKQYDKTLDKFLSWHRNSELMRYRDWLVELKAVALAEPDQQTLMNTLEPMQAFGSDALIYIFDDTARLLSSLSDEQVKEMLGAMNDQQEAFEDDYRDEDTNKWKKRQIKTVKKFSKRFIGKLNKDQDAIVEAWIEKQKNLNNDWLDNRKNWTANFAQVLTLRNKPEQEALFKERLYLLFVEPQKLHKPDYTQAINHNINNSSELMVGILASLNDKQREKLTKQFDKYIRILEDLAK